MPSNAVIHLSARPAQALRERTPTCEDVLKVAVVALCCSEQLFANALKCSHGLTCSLCITLKSFSSLTCSLCITLKSFSSLTCLLRFTFGFVSSLLCLLCLVFKSIHTLSQKGNSLPLIDWQLTCIALKLNKTLYVHMGGRPSRHMQHTSEVFYALSRAG